MRALSPEVLASYWSANEIATNIVVFMNLVGALLLGFILGYERSYHGRAAGMRTYGLVGVASCACTVIAGYPASWYGGAALLQAGGAAILLTLLSAACMLYVSKLEAWLPSRHAISVSLRFLPEFMPQEISIRKSLLDMGYEVAGGSFSVGYQGRAQEWRFVAVALGQSIGKPLAEMPVKLIGLDGVDSFNVAHARN
jgi:putative Mg2+ transporter-C (MgtC) family protein